jgi:hypothetical protein
MLYTIATLQYLRPFLLYKLRLYYRLLSKELGDKAIAYLAGSKVTKKKFRNIVSTLSGTR